MDAPAPGHPKCRFFSFPLPIVCFVFPIPEFVESFVADQAATPQAWAVHGRGRARHTVRTIKRVALESATTGGEIELV